MLEERVTPTHSGVKLYAVDINVESYEHRWGPLSLTPVIQLEKLEETVGNLLSTNFHTT